MRIEETNDGIDFFFSAKQDARKLVDFLSNVVPCRYKTSQELVSHDIHNNTYQYKHTFSVEIVPVCKNDIVCLPLKLSKSLGNIGQIVICNRVTTAIQLINPRTLQVAEVSSNMYWRTPFSALCGYRQLKEFYVLHIEPLEQKRHTTGASNLSKKVGWTHTHTHTHIQNVLSDVWVAPINQLGSMEIPCRTHLGHLLSSGDVVWGFSLSTANLNDSPEDIPDVAHQAPIMSGSESLHPVSQTCPVLD